MSEYKQTYINTRDRIISAIRQFISDVDKDGHGQEALDKLNQLSDSNYVTRLRFSKSDRTALLTLYDAVNHILNSKWTTRPELANLLQDFLNEQGFTDELHRSESAAPHNGGKPGSNRQQPTGDTGASSARAAFNAKAFSQEIPEPEYKSAEKQVLSLMKRVIEASNYDDIIKNISELLKITSQELCRTENIPESEIERLHPLYQVICTIITSNNTSSNAAAQQHQRRNRFLRAGQAEQKAELGRSIDAIKKEFRRLLDNQPNDRPQQKPRSLKRNYDAAAVDNPLAQSPKDQKKKSGSLSPTAFQALATHCKNLLNLIRRYIRTPEQRSNILKEILETDYIPFALKSIEKEYLTIFTDLRDAMLRAAKLETEEARLRAFKRILDQSKPVSCFLKTITPPQGSGPGASWNP